MICPKCNAPHYNSVTLSTFECGSGYLTNDQNEEEFTQSTACAHIVTLQEALGDLVDFVADHKSHLQCCEADGVYTIDQLLGNADHAATMFSKQLD